ncbi:MAG TPA: DUF5719 family protein, partial [Nitriliruptoraceae bacterium]|nr:DUF5719 family protein [Nitriliruptoraceae bacterium]
MTSQLRPTVIIVAVVVLALAVALLVSQPAAAPVGQDEPVDEAAQVVVEAEAGPWYCPAEDGDADDGDTRVVAVRPAVDTRPARFTTRDIGATGVTQIGEVFPGAGQQVTGPESSLEVRWTDRPVTVSRLTTVSAEPAGVLARPCVSRVAASWTLPGLTTAAGSSVTLRLTNPLSQEAAVAVEGLTPQGREAPIVLQNIAVPAGETVEVDVNEFLPQQPDLAMFVVARSGRVVVDAVLESQPTVSGVSGRSPLVATAQTQTRWFLPWVATPGRADGRGTGPVGDQLGGIAPTAGPTDAATETAEPTATEEPTATAEPTATPSPTAQSTEATDESTGDATESPDDILDVVVEGEAEPASWIWLANPNEEPASVELSWLTAQGRMPASILGTIEVGAGAVRRLSLNDVLPAVEGDVGVDVQVTNDVPIAVAGGSVVVDGDGAERSGIGVLNAVALDDDVVSMTTVSAQGREQWLTLANPFGVRAVVDLRVWNGATSQAPEALRGLELGPGETVSLDVGEWATGSGEFTVFSMASEGSVTGAIRGLAPSGPMSFSTTAGVPLAIWRANESLVGVVGRPGMVNRMGTDLGMPTEVGTPTPTPAPVVPADGGDLPTGVPSATESPGATPSVAPSDGEGQSSGATPTDG